MIRPRAGRQVPRELDVDLHRALAHRRIDADDLARHDAVARVDGDVLTRDDVLDLRLRNAELGNQLVGPRDARDVRAGLHLLPLLDHDFLHDAGETGAHGQRLHLLEHALICVLILREARALRGDLRFDGCAELVQALDLDLVRGLQRFGRELRPADLQLRDDARCTFGLGLQPGRFVLRVRLGDGGLLVELLAAARELELSELGFRDLEPVTRLLGLTYEVGIRQLGQDRVGRDDGTGAHEHGLDAPRRLGRDPAELARLERPGAAHLDHELTALDGARVQRVAIHSRRGRLEARQCNGDDGERDGRTGTNRDAPHAFAFLVFRAWYVHTPPRATSVPCERTPFKALFWRKKCGIDAGHPARASSRERFRRPESGTNRLPREPAVVASHAALEIASRGGGPGKRGTAACRHAAT